MRWIGRLLILLALSSLGCAGDDWTSRILILVDVTGTWEGTFYFSTGRQLPIRWVLQQSGAKVRGESHGPDGPNGSIEGSVNAELLNWTVTGPFVKFVGQRPLAATYRGEATVDIDQLSGRADGFYCPCTVLLRRVTQ
jgi:hypothetical protein